MAVERSAGIILFRNTPRGREYLVIRSSREDKTKPEFWDFPKGVLEPGEKGIDAAHREAGEEVGIKGLKLCPNFKDTVHYFTRRDGKPVPKYVAMFLAESKTEKVRLSWEHDKYEWLPYEGAYQRISLPQMKKVLKSAEEYLRDT